MGSRVGPQTGSPGRAARHPWAAGQALVEFAFTMPLLVLVLVSIFEGGRLISSYVAVANAAYEGTHTGRFTKETDADIRNAVRSAQTILGRIPDNQISISPAYPRISGGSIGVTVTYPYTALEMISQSWGGAVLNLTAQATGAVE